VPPAGRKREPRAVWSGTIAFGLVTVPVRLYPAVRERSLHFRLVHEPDSSPIGYEKICKAEGKSVPDREVAKAYEVRKGEFVVLDDADFEAARVEGNRSIQISDFVPLEEIDPVYFAHTYQVGPEEGAERAYALLARAMESSGLAAIATFVMRAREYLAALRVHDGTLLLEQLHFADEVQPLNEIRPRRTKVDDRELKMAGEMIDSLRASFEPERYHDTYREALLEVIKAKGKGEVREAPAPAEEAEEPPDLLEALRASVEAAKQERSGRSRKRTATPRRGGSRRGQRKRTRA
jgi:DNA end-binding protein Ku